MCFLAIFMGFRATALHPRLYAAACSAEAEKMNIHIAENLM
jgi:hypothetical protein